MTVAGTVLQCGATDYWAIGRSKETRLEYPCLAVPHKLKELEVGFHLGFASMAPYCLIPVSDSLG